MQKKQITKRRYNVGKLHARNKMALGEKRRKTWELSQYFTRQLDLVKGTNKERMLQRKLKREKKRESKWDL